MLTSPLISDHGRRPRIVAATGLPVRDGPRSRSCPTRASGREAAAASDLTVFKLLAFAA
jgi:hypothetical protein